MFVFSNQALDGIRKSLADFGETSGTKTRWKFLERIVCVAAWKKLHALGCSILIDDGKRSKPF